MEAISAEDIDTLARRIEALSIEGRDVTSDIDELLSASDLSGGWGLTSEFTADPLDTALALIALANSESTDVNQVIDAISFLMVYQNPDGGWGCIKDSPSDISCTAQIILALNAYRDQLTLGTTLNTLRAQQFLKAALNPDGSIGGSSANPIYTTSIAAYALVEAGDELEDDRLNIIAFLEGEQFTDGSWNSDPFLTAVAIRALNRLSLIPVCGDGVINKPTETCDGSDLGEAACDSIGFDNGILSCTSQCTLDTSGCTIVDNPPVITSPPFVIASEGQLYSYDVEATDPNGEVMGLKMYWADPGTTGIVTKIQRANLDGSEIEDIVNLQGIPNGPWAIALDSVHNKMYWADSFGLRRANLDGSAIEFISGEVHFLGLAIDSIEDKIYWTDNTRIRRSNLDGSSVETLVLDSVLAGMALDLNSEKMYWTRRRSVGAGSTGEIKRANLDGTNIETLITGVGDPFKIALDINGGKMYWTHNYPSGKVQRANLDGSDIETLAAGSARFSGIALDLGGGKMYWTHGLSSGKIQRANLDGSNIETLVTGLGQPIGIALLLDSVPPLTFSLDIAPTGMTIDEVTGHIEWTPNSSQVGEHDITVRVEDADGLFDIQSFTITVIPTIKDIDGDGFPSDIDCDDEDENVNPGVTESLGNDIDDDCNPGTPDVIIPDELTCTVSTDKITYGAQEEIRVEVVLKRTGGIGSLSGLQLELDVEHAASIILGNVSEPLIPISPDERRQLNFFFSTGNTPPDIVSVTAEVLGDSEVITSCVTETTIISSAEVGVNLTGSIVAEPSVAHSGEEISFPYSIKNVGNILLDPVNIKILVTNPATGSVAATLTDSTILDTGETFDGLQTTSLTLPVNDYLVILQGGVDNKFETLDSASLKITNTPPVAQCKDVTVFADNNCQASADINNSSYDPDGDSITLDYSQNSPYQLGDTEVTLTVTDDKGASNTCQATVTVVDNIPPVITCPTTQIAECTGLNGASVSFTATATDNCSEIIATSCNPLSNSLFPLGETMVTCTATDNAGNQNSCDFNVKV